MQQHLDYASSETMSPSIHNVSLARCYGRRMRIRYTGSPRELAMIRGDLDTAGIQYTTDGFTEQRGGAEIAFAGVILIVGGFAQGFGQAAGADAYAKTKELAKKWHAKPLLGKLDVEE